MDIVREPKKKKKLIATHKDSATHPSHSLENHYNLTQ